MSEYRKIDEREVIDRISGKDVLILCHMNPDADSIGSAFAVAEIIRLTGGKAKVVSETKFPERLLFLCDGQTGEYTEGDEDGKTVIAVDVASPTQLGKLGHLKDKTDIMIDHHAFGDAFADNLIYSTASSAGEVITGIYKIMVEEGRIPESPYICRHLFASVASDTGSFKYSNTTPKTLMTAAYLVERINGDKNGIDTSEISRLLFDTKTFDELKGQQLAMEKLHTYLDGRLAVCSISKKDCVAHGISMDDLADIIEVPRSVRGVDVAVALKEKSDGIFRASTRANGDFNVAEVCTKFGGGGHVRAAGASVNAVTSDEAEKIMVDAFTEAMEKANG